MLFCQTLFSTSILADTFQFYFYFGRHFFILPHSLFPQTLFLFYVILSDTFQFYFYFGRHFSVLLLLWQTLFSFTSILADTFFILLHISRHFFVLNFFADTFLYYHTHSYFSRQLFWFFFYFGTLFHSPLHFCRLFYYKHLCRHFHGFWETLFSFTFILADTLFFLPICLHKFFLPICLQTLFFSPYVCRHFFLF